MAVGMSSDDSLRQGSRGFIASGVGLVPKFRCARCNLSRLTEGRRKQRVQGLMQYVCRGCVK